ncbi:MAG: hypothetical protein ABWY58_15675 [Aeromicrobium sp.]
MTTGQDVAGTSTFSRLFDDAAIFPPGNASMRDAVAAHLARRSRNAQEFVGPFVCSVPRLAELRDELQQVGPATEPLHLCLTVPEGVHTLAAAQSEIAAEPRVVLRALEIAVGHEDAARAAEEVLAILPAAVEAYLEFPRSADPRRTASALVGTGLRLKFRTGGVEADAFPDERVLARAIRAAVEADVPFKLTAGLHHAIRHRDISSGRDFHGFLNVIIAVASAQRGEPGEHISTVLAELQAPTLVEAFTQLTVGERADVRDHFRSFGTCDITEPLTDLVNLDLLPGGVVA